MFVTKMITIAFFSILVLFLIIVPTIKILFRLKYAKNISKINDGSYRIDSKNIKISENPFTSMKLEHTFSILNIHHDDNK